MTWGFWSVIVMANSRRETYLACYAVANRLAKADSLTTWLRDGAVKLRMTDSGPGAERPVTVMTAFKETVDRVPDRIALCELLNYCKTWSFRPFQWEIRARQFLIRIVKTVPPFSA